MSIQIRQANFSSNQAAIKEINDSINWKDSIKGEGLEAYLETTKKVVGYVQFNKQGSLLSIDHIAVHKNAQGKGIGKKLLQEALAIAQEKGFSSVDLLSSTQKSNAFYKACASKLRIPYQAEESGFFEDPEGSLRFTFPLNENTPWIERTVKQPAESFFGYYKF